MMEDLSEKIKNSKKTTPVKVIFKCNLELEFIGASVYHIENIYIVFGEYDEIKKVLNCFSKDIYDLRMECNSRNSAIPFLDIKNINARIEPGALIREDVLIGENAIIMMGAIINIGAIIGEKTMIDMGAVIGSKVMIGKRCHIGANAIVSGVIDPPSYQNVVIEDDVFVGAGAVIVEGVRIGNKSIIAAGCVVTKDVPSEVVVAGVPGKIIKHIDIKSISKTSYMEEIRKI